jgi:hypothetical protein
MEPQESGEEAARMMTCEVFSARSMAAEFRGRVWKENLASERDQH